MFFSVSQTPNQWKEPNMLSGVFNFLRESQVLIAFVIVTGVAGLLGSTTGAILASVGLAVVIVLAIKQFV